MISYYIIGAIAAVTITAIAIANIVIGYRNFRLRLQRLREREGNSD